MDCIFLDIKYYKIKKNKKLWPAKIIYNTKNMLAALLIDCHFLCNMIDSVCLSVNFDSLGLRLCKIVIVIDTRQWCQPVLLNATHKSLNTYLIMYLDFFRCNYVTSIGFFIKI